MGSHERVCSICEQSFAPDDVIDIEGYTTCAGCKPQLVARIQQGMGFSAHTVARHKKRLVVGLDSELPERCVKCNEPAARMLKRSVYWHSPAVYAVLLLNILIYILIAVLVRKTAKVEIGLCDRHLRRRRMAIGVGWLTLALLILSIAVGIGIGAEFIIFGTLTAIIVWLGCSAASYTVSASKIDKEYVWLRGVCRDYLDELPEF